MLGRLFKQNSSTSLKDMPSAQSPSIINSYEDSYTREILYGTSEKLISESYDLNSKYFRLLVSQDGGSLRSKQVLFDSSSTDKPNAPTIHENATHPAPTNHPTNHPVPTNHSGHINHPGHHPGHPGHTAPGQKYSRNMLGSKMYHNVGELHEYMFGCGLPTNEHHSVTKIHLLPIINTHNGSYRSVLITRLFLITDFQDLGDFRYSENWDPKPTLPINNTKISFQNPNSSNKNNLTSRFAVGAVIPIKGEGISEVIANNWHEICHFLIILQKTCCKKMLNVLNNHNNDYIINKRIQFPGGIFANDLDLNNNLIKLIKLINYNANIPKLMNTNSLMKLSLNGKNHKFDPILLDWVLEIINWMEFKELNEHAKFLSTLLALIIPYRHSLTRKSLFHDYKSNSKEITRIVIMTGNPMVAKKLVFILNGLIPDGDIYKLLNSEEPEEEGVHPRDEIVAYSPTEEEVDLDTDVDELDEETEDNFSLPSPPLLNAIKPIPIKKTALHSFSSSENSFSSSVKGWEIPGKATPIASTSVSNSFINNSPSSVTNIPITSNNRRQSISKSSSMAYLSSSLNSSLSSSASNYSLSKLGGSFVEKWRNSFNSSMNYDNIDYHPNIPAPAFSRRASTNLKSPSPSIEVEGFNVGSGCPSPILILNSSFAGAAGKLSKTQSMYDLYSGNKSAEVSQLKNKLIGNLLQRTKSCIHDDVPIKDNREAIAKQISKLMDHEYKELDYDENSIEVNDFEEDTPKGHFESLSPNVAFTDEFRPEFILQSCPMNPRLEQNITSAMKNDLLFHQNNCGLSNITTRTIFISLRAREIKLIEMKVGDIKSDPNSIVATPVASSVESPISSYFDTSITGQPHTQLHTPAHTPLQTPTSSSPISSFPFKKLSNSYKTSIKKVFSPHSKSNGNNEIVNIIDNNLNEIKKLFLKHMTEINNDSVSTNNDFNENLARLVLNLLN